MHTIKKRTVAAFILACISPLTLASSIPVITLTTKPGATTILPQVGQGNVNYQVSLSPMFPGKLGPLSVQGGLPTGVNQVTDVPSSCPSVPTVCGNSFSLSPGGSCCLMLTMTGTDMELGNNLVRPLVATSPATYSSLATPLNVSVVAHGPILTSSVQDVLALSVSCLSLNSVPSGTARTITITNNGDRIAENLQVNTTPAVPTDMNQTNTCSSTLAPSQSCVITITPTETATLGAGGLACTKGIAPIYDVVTVSANNASSVLTDVVVLGYGCIYQGGYVYSMSETADTSQSIGGTVTATEDQVSPLTGVFWSSGGTAGNQSYDIIPGIDQLSTTGNALPPYSQTTTYPPLTPLPSSAFNACNGNLDGNCDTNNILAFYNYYITNQNTANPAVIGITPLPYYAAGACKATINNYSDWYLPSICELGYQTDTSAVATGCGTLASPTKQNMAANLPMLMGTTTTNCTIGANCLSGVYWSSTESSLLPLYFALNQTFPAPDSYPQNYNDKGNPFPVRCSRALSN